MPWRETKDPYRIWISEIMLQQTQVETVIPYYHRWLKKFPNVTTLAEAPLDQVLKLWEGLGYYRRARNMHESAKIIVNRHGGKFPADLEEIRKLPGIGRYTAGAVASIAFGKPAPLVDGNVARVFARVFTIKDPVDSSKTQKKLWDLAARLIPQENPGDFNQALMELGATLCLPSHPLCSICPVSKLCGAHRLGQEQNFPRKMRQPPAEKVKAVCGIVRSHGKILITKRPDRGLWASLWEFPTFRVSEKEKPEVILTKGLQKFGITLLVTEKKTRMRRSYTNHSEDLHVYECKPLKKKGKSPLVRTAPLSRWVRREELGRFTFPSAHAKIIQNHLWSPTAFHPVPPWQERLSPSRQRRDEKAG